MIGTTIAAKAKSGRHAATGNNEHNFTSPNTTAAMGSTPPTSGRGAGGTAYMPVVQPGFSGGGPNAPLDPMEEARKSEDRKKRLKIAGIVGGSILGVLLLVYIIGAVIFMGRFLPNTVIGTTDISLMSGDEVKGLLDERADGYTTTITGYSVDLTLSADEMGLTLDSDAVVNTMLSATNPWAWPIELFGSHDVSEGLTASTEGTSLSDAVTAAVDAVNAEATPPTNAAVTYNSDLKTFIVTPESVGTQLNFDATLATITEGIAVLSEEITLGEDTLEQPTVFSSDERLATGATQANSMLTANVALTMANETAATIDASTISGWIAFDENFTPYLSDDALASWASDIADSHTTVGSTRTYTRPDGEVITVSGGTYGWTVDEDALIELTRTAVSEGQQGTQELPTTGAAQAWSGTTGKDWGNRYIDVDISEQHARMYDDSGTLIWESDIVSGTPGTHDTTQGVWTILEKMNPKTLTGETDAATGQPEYVTEVTYWARITWTGIGFHDATWQSAFGGTRYTSGYGSHGCINLPYSAAASLYELVKVGDVVVVHD